jgi:hypothetical protein
MNRHHTIHNGNDVDLQLLKSVVSKLEESAASCGVTHFSTEKIPASLTTLTRDFLSDYRGAFAHSLDDDDKLKDVKIRRMVLTFSQKPLSTLGNHYGRYPTVVGTDTSDFTSIAVTWDIITDIVELYFSVYGFKHTSKEGVQVFEANNSENITINFGTKYRRDMRLIKNRLGKLFMVKNRDVLLIREEEIRQIYSQSVLGLIPDLYDSILFNGADDEK